MILRIATRNSITAIFMFLATSMLVIGCVSKDDYYNELVKVSQSMNKTCPVKIDDNTQLDSTSVIKSPLTLKYYYTAVALDLATTDIDLNDVKKVVQDASQKNYNTVESMKSFRDNNILLQYYYLDNKGKFMFDFTISPKKKKQQ